MVKEDIESCDGGTTAAPKSADSTIDAEDQIGRRRRLRRPKSSEFPDGQNNEEVPSVANEKNDKKTRKSRINRRREKEENSTSGNGSGGGSGSVLFTILLIGLAFSLFDVIYIIVFVERQNIGGMKPGPIHVTSDSTQTYNAPIVGSGGGHKSADASIQQPSPAINEHAGAGLFGDKARLVSLLTKAGFTIDPVQDKELIDDLPTWSEVVGMYGSEPVIYGLDQCQKFQLQSDPALHFLGVAGTFNTGTNLMAELLIANCHMQARMDKFGAQNRGIRWQVPWGKHTPPGDEEFRQSHKTEKDMNVDANNILAATTVRDPLVWLGSMCRHAYAAHWEHGEDDKCPDFSLPDLRTTVKYALFTREHDSILHLWNAYYQEYVQANFPRLIVRYEDLIFHPEEVTKKVCECAGGSMRPDGKFKYIVDSAKKGDGAHGKTRTGYADALVKYGSEKRRYKIYRHASDLEYIRDHVDPALMELLHYPIPDPAKVNVV